MHHVTYLHIFFEVEIIYTYNLQIINSNLIQLEENIWFGPGTRDSAS